MVLAKAKENPLTELPLRKGVFALERYSVKTSQSHFVRQLPYRGEPLAKPFTLRGLPKPLLQGEVASRSDDGEVVLRQSLPFVGKSGSWHRFLYLFSEVYGILILHAVETLLRSRVKPE